MRRPPETSRREGFREMGVRDGRRRPQAVPQSAGVDQELLDGSVPDLRRSDCDVALGRLLLVSVELK